MVVDESLTEKLDVTELIPELTSFTDLGGYSKELKPKASEFTSVALFKAVELLKESIIEKQNTYNGSVVTTERDQLAEAILSEIDLLQLMDSFFDHFSGNDDNGNVRIEAFSEVGWDSRINFYPENEKTPLGQIGTKTVNEISIFANAGDPNKISIRFYGSKNTKEPVSNLDIFSQDNQLFIELNTPPSEVKTLTSDIPELNDETMHDLVNCFKIGITSKINEHPYAKVSTTSVQKLADIKNNASIELEAKDINLAELKKIEPQIANIQNFIAKSFDSAFLDLAAESIRIYGKHQNGSLSKEVSAKETVMNWIMGIEQTPLTPEKLVKNKGQIFILDSACQELDSKNTKLEYPTPEEKEQMAIVQGIIEIGVIKARQLAETLPQDEERNENKSKLELIIKDLANILPNDKRILTLNTLRNMVK